MKEHRVEARYRREHGKKPVVLSAGDDVDTLIEELLAGPAYHNLAQLHSLERPPLPSGYPDHELLVGVDRHLPVGVLAFMDAESGNMVTLGLSQSRDSAQYLIMGQMTEFPDNSEVPLEVVREAVNEFLFSGGQRPSCVRWQTPETW